MQKHFGILNEDAVEFAKNAHENHNISFKTVYTAIELTSRYINLSKDLICNNDQEEIMALMKKIKQRAESICYLCEVGNTDDAKVLLRSLFEQTVMMKLCSEDVSNLKLYAQKSFIETEKWLKYYIENNSETNKQEYIVTRNRTNQLLDSIGREAKKYNNYKLAQKSGLDKEYMELYSFLSEEVHSSYLSLLMSLPQFAQSTGDSVEEMKQKEIAAALKQLGRYLLISIDSFSSFFVLGDKELGEFNIEL